MMGAVMAAVSLLVYRTAEKERDGRGNKNRNFT